MEKDNIHLPQNPDTFSLGAGLSISTKSDIKNAISITNNRAQYYSNLAKKFRDEAKIHCDNAKHYAEENSNVTYDQLIDLRNVLETEINTKQEKADYVLKEELPVNVSEFENDSNYATKEEVTSVVDSVRLPKFENNSEQFLCNDGENITWKHIPREKMFALRWFDKKLSFEESKGYALQGTWVYKESAPERYGYPDFYNKCIEEKNAGEETSLTIGENTITIYKNANGHVFYNISDKEIIDELFQQQGIAWYYGIDAENERIFLPRNEWFTQSTAGLDEVGQAVQAGLPNITGSTKGTQIFFQGRNVDGKVGAITTTQTGTVSLSSGSGSQSFNSFEFNAADSNSIYGNSDTVQPASVKQLLYIVVGNTEEEKSVTNVSELTTSENDTIPLFTGMYFDFKPNNASWLKAGEQVNSGSIYTSAYNELVNELTNPKYRLKVIEESEMISGVDYSEYWKINQDEMYFVTPTKLSYLPIDSDIIPVVGNGNALGLSNGNYLHGHNSGYEAGLQPYSSATIPEANSAGGTLKTSTNFLGISTDSLNSGLVADLSSAKSNIAQLYFKVANAVQNLELLDVGKVVESLADKIGHNECKTYITETYQNGTSWYCIYSPDSTGRRRCKQGGSFNQTTNGTITQTIQLLKSLADTEYSVLTSGDVRSLSLTTSSFTGQWAWGNGGSNYGIVFWEVSGYLAKGED